MQSFLIIFNAGDVVWRTAALFYRFLYVHFLLLLLHQMGSFFSQLLHPASRLLLNDLYSYMYESWALTGFTSIQCIIIILL
mmetsp:Transcript_11263/g.18616  ORF Transcript_11263/g.18616 Transcript_11263/m.18616 type:complete len:81 (+) Transcript_11263:1254-1496(+)